MDIAGKCVIITGGSSGIGKEIARIFARRRANVFIVARREEVLRTTIAEVKQEAADSSQRFGYFSADVSDLNAVGNAVSAAEAECGPPAVLINAAGIVNPGYAEELSISGMEAEVGINYLGTMYMIKHVLNGMIERQSGWILNVSSLGGLKGIFGYTGYSGSKFAIVGFSEALRSEMRPHGIRVSVLCPPDVDTPTFEEENKVKPLETKRISEGGKVMQPQDVARAAVDGMEKGTFLIIPNFPGKMFYYANRLVPSLIDRFIGKTVDKVRKERGL